MSKIIDIIRRGKPEDGGYPDSVAIVGDDKNSYVGKCATYPNPFQPSTKKPWQDVYACLADQDLTGKCILHLLYQKCLLVNDGGQCVTINPNVNHDNKYYATEVFVHCGETAIWRGSRGCITVPPDQWADFMNQFTVGEVVKIILRHEGIV